LSSSSISATFAAVFAVVSLPGCIVGGAGVTHFIHPEGAVLEVGVDRDFAAAEVGFEILTIRMVSTQGDTLRDTLDASGQSLSNPDARFADAPTSSAFNPRYEVPPMSAWKIDLEAIDAGQVVGSGSATTGRLTRGDTLRVPVSLLPRS